MPSPPSGSDTGYDDDCKHQWDINDSGMPMVSNFALLFVNNNHNFRPVIIYFENVRTRAQHVYYSGMTSIDTGRDKLI